MHIHLCLTCYLWEFSFIFAIVFAINEIRMERIMLMPNIIHKFAIAKQLNEHLSHTAYELRSSIANSIYLQLIYNRIHILALATISKLVGLSEQWVKIVVYTVWNMINKIKKKKLRIENCFREVNVYCDNSRLRRGTHSGSWLDSIDNFNYFCFRINWITRINLYITIWKLTKCMVWY